MRSLVLACALALAGIGRPLAAEAPPEITIDVEVKLAEAKVVFNLDHLAFAGDEPVGLDFMRIMLDRFRDDGTRFEIVAIFHGAAGYMLLDDEKYDVVRHWQGGNPYKEQIAGLIAAGVSVEECGQTMRDMGWTNADLLPGTKVNTGANFRIVELVQEGFVQIQP
jgi:intracellular sulfur oxidation DsrE/DsrF family protein